MDKYLVETPVHGIQLTIVSASSKKEAMRKVDAGHGEPLDHLIKKHSKSNTAELIN